eukprot:snap_masked-scaffold_39-processed-gene-2.27-mRNA-1 protein AED:1.00 eAED:1.00 QI:0/0/0/0/1/1/2/0/107
MVFLTREAERIPGRYDPEEVLLELKKVIPWSILRSLDPWNSLTLTEFLSSIDKRYNSLEELNIAKSKITSFKLDPALSRTENICNFVNLYQDGVISGEGKLGLKIVL